MLSKILTVSGKPGLFKLISQGKGMYIVENIMDSKRFPTYPRDKVVVLGDVAIYTTGDDVALGEVLNAMKEKSNGEKVVLADMQPATLRAYIETVLPEFDRDRVYPSDIKKLISWYNLLVEAKMTDFLSVEGKEEAAEEKTTEEKTEA